MEGWWQPGKDVSLNEGVQRPVPSVLSFPGSLQASTLRGIWHLGFILMETPEENQSRQKFLALCLVSCAERSSL